MANFEFNSAICTSREQSERLLKLGLKKETADCHWFYHDEHWEIKIGFDLMSCENLYPKYYIPAWSLYRLIELAEVSVEISGLWIKISGAYRYEEKDNVYDNLIDAIKELIDNDVFNKDYLGEKL